MALEEMVFHVAFDPHSIAKNMGFAIFIWAKHDEPNPSLHPQHKTPSTIH
jgi:hypothetical protein